MGWTAPRTWVASEVVTAAIMNTHVRDNLSALNGYVEKTADQSISSSTVLTNDTDLLLTIGATGKYLIECNLWATAAANAGPHIKFGFSFPAGTFDIEGWGPHNSIASGTAVQTEWITVQGATSGTSSVGYGATTSVLGYFLRCRFTATATGTVRLMWAQSVSSASATTVKARSYLEMKQVA